MRLNQEQKIQIQAEKEAGVSTKDIAAKFGIHPSTVLKAAKDVPKIKLPTTEDVDLGERAGFLDPTPAPVPRPPEPKTPPFPDHPALDKFFAGLEGPAPQAPVPRPAPELPRGDPDELVQKILLNAESFPELFPNPPSIDSLASKSVNQLAEVLQSMETSRAVRMLTVQLKQVFLVGSRATEVMGKQYLGLKTDGLTDGLISQQKELDYLFRELAIKHSKKFGKVVEPEVRLLMLFGITVLQTDAANRVKDRLAQQNPASTAEKFGDL